MKPIAVRPAWARRLLFTLALVGPCGWAQGPLVNAIMANPTTADEGAAVSFTVDATHPGDAPLRFAWDFGDGTQLPPDPTARSSFHHYRDQGEFTVTVTVEDVNGESAVGSTRVSVRNVAPTIRGIDRDGSTLERNEVTFRARAFDPGADALSYRWDFGDGTVLGPSERLEVARHAYERAGSYTLTLTVEDGDGGSATYSETIVVGVGFRYTVSGAVSAAGDGESPYLTGLPVVRDGSTTRFAGDLMAAALGDPAAAAGASCLVSFGSRSRSLASMFQAGVAVSFTGILSSGLQEGAYPVAVVHNELPFRIYQSLEREWAQPDTFFVTLSTLRFEGELPIGEEFLGVGGSVVVERVEHDRVELTFSANLEEWLNALDLIDTPTGPQLPPPLTAQVEGSFAHEPKRSMVAGEGSLNPLAGAGFGDWYLCSPRAPLEVEEVVPSLSLASGAGGGRDVPLIDFVEPEIVVRFSRPVDIGSAVENVVLEWRRADGNFVEVPMLVIGAGDDTLRLSPLEDLMDGVVYRARVEGGQGGVQGRAGELLDEDVEWLFETMLDLSEARSGVTLATTQVARDAPLVAGKPTETRVYLNWRERPQVHPQWQTRYATFEVAVAGGDYAAKRVRVKRPDLYGPDERKNALDSVNFYGWEPEAAGSHTLTARATQAGQLGPERAFEGSWTVAGYGAAPALTFDYHFVRVGSWAEGVPADARSLGHRIARLGAVFSEQNFPVPSVTARYRGEVVIDEPNVPIVEAMGQEFYLHSLASVRRRDEVLVAAYAEQLGATTADVVVAFLPKDVLRLSGFAYSALGDNPRVIAIQVDPSFTGSIEHYPSTVAHEIAHTLGLPHSSDCPKGGVAGCVDQGQSDAIEGTRMAAGGASGWNKSRWGGNAEAARTPGSVLSLMHPENLPDVAAFITNADYARLQEAVRALAARPAEQAWAAMVAAAQASGGLLRAQSAPVRGLQVDGAIDAASGRALLWSVVPSERAALPAGAELEGGAHLEARAADGTLLARTRVAGEPPDADHPPAAPASLRPFTAFLATGGEVATLTLLAAEQPLVVWHASAHAPQLALPASPIAVAGPLQLSWSAFDADGDPLHFDVDYAADGGDWQPLALHLRTPTLLLTPEALAPGRAPTLRITARDGLRSSSAELALVLSSAPRLLATAPAAGEVVATTTAVTVWTLGELIELGPEAVTLERLDPPAGLVARVPGRVERLPAGDGVRFVPAEPLAADADYRASFGAGVTGADGTPFAGPHAWSFRTGATPPEPAFEERNLSGRPLASAASSKAVALEAELPALCAGFERATFAPLVPAGATLSEALEVEGACRLVVVSGGNLEEVRSFVERAILSNRLFFTGNRAEGGAVRIGARGAAFSAEAVIEPGPPTRLTWTLRARD